MSEKLIPRVGVGVLIQNEKGEVLLGERLNSLGAGKFSVPGGKMEFGETIFQCARRELKEETGLDVNHFELISIYDELEYLESDNAHFVTIGVRGCCITEEEPKNLEPEKCWAWQWFSLDSLPDNMLDSARVTIQNFKDKLIYKEKI